MTTPTTAASLTGAHRAASHLTRWINTSLCLRPFAFMATAETTTLPMWLKPLAWLIPACCGGVWHGLLWLLVPVWLISWAFLETGPIGLLTWAVLGVSLCRAKAFKAWPVLNGLDAMVAVFFATAVIAAAASTVQPQSLEGLSKIATFMAGYAAFRLLPKGFQRGVVPVTLVGLGLFEAMVGLYQYINHIQPLATWEDPTINPELKLTRIFGTLKPSNPNLLAGYLITPLVLSVGMVLHAAIAHRWRLALLLLPAGGAMLAGLVLTGSRGGFLAMASMGVAAFVLVGHLLFNDPQWPAKRQSRWAWLSIAGVSLLGVGAALAVSPSLQHRVASIFSMRDDSSNAFRLNVYQSAWHMFTDNWLVGIGPGNGTFKLVYGLYMVPGFTALSAYSVPLEIAVEQGILGLLAFAGLLITTGVRGLLVIDNDETALGQKLLVISAIVAVIGSLTYGAFDTIWYRPSVNLGFWWLLAVIATMTSATPNRITTSAGE
jgi:putative inorganic carbon (hco3(-)) transporter